MQFLLSHCEYAFTQHGSLLLTLFLAGLVGGFTHCSGMCGPFVVAQVDGSDCNGSKLRKLSGMLLLPYHLGRMTTYMFLGVMSAFLSKQIIGMPLQQWISGFFLTLAGVMFILSAAPQAKKVISLLPLQGFYKISSLIGRLASRLFSKENTFKGYGLGVLLGFLPCGLIFAALMAISTTGSVFVAAFAMLLFTIGTFPSMFLVGMGGQLLLRKWPNMLRNIARGVMVFNGFSLFFLAGHMVF